jgi:1-acyl-sn-glycerol-3-phosphate acyltransferase
MGILSEQSIISRLKLATAASTASKAKTEVTTSPLFWKSCQVIARILTTSLFDLKVHGLENIPKQGGAMIVSNHQSYLDPIVLGTRLCRPLSYMAKEELFEVAPAFTWLLRQLGAFPVHQGKKNGDVHALKESIERLREGSLLNIYPEGSRTYDGKIGKIEKGFALIDRRSHVPVIPAVIVGGFAAWPIHRTFPQPGPIYVQFGPPMQLANLAPREIVMAVDLTLRKMFNELYANTLAASRSHREGRHHARKN